MFRAGVVIHFFVVYEIMNPDDYDKISEGREEVGFSLLTPHWDVDSGSINLAFQTLVRTLDAMLSLKLSSPLFAH